MSTPQTGAPEWDSQQASPWLPANKARRTFDAFALRTSVADRDLTAPPGSCADGARYLIATVATGLWAGHDGELAIAFGTNASNGWVFATIANEGVQIWIEDEQTQIEYVGGSWVVSPERVMRLDELADVDLAGLNDGDQIYWDASNGQWYPAPPGGGGGATALSELTDIDFSGGIPDGYVLTYSASDGKWYPGPQASGGGSVTFASTTEQLTGTEAVKASSPDSVAALWEQGSDVASAGTISLGEGGYFNVTGTTTITDVDFATDKAGRKAWVKFAGVLTLTHNASTLILPTGANIVTAAGDTACFVSEGSDVVRCVAYQRASGAALVGSGGATSLAGLTDVDLTGVTDGMTLVYEASSGKFYAAPPGYNDFLDLTDTPDTYSGQGGKVVAVKSDATGLEFLDITTGGFETLDVDYTDGGNSGTTETDLFTYTVPASELSVDGDRLEAQWAGTFVSSGTATRQLRAYFGGTLIFDTGALTLSTSSAWDIFCTITRVSATVVRYAVSMTTQGAALAAYTASGEVTGLTLSNTNVFKLTGTAAGVGAASNDIVGKTGSVEKRPVNPSAADGAAWVLAGSWTWSTNVANVDFTGLGIYSDLIVIFRNVTLSVSGQPALQLSVNNGSSFYTTSGDYVAVPASGTESAATNVALTNAAATAARSAIASLPGINVSGAPKFIDRNNRDDSGSALFVASNSPVNAIRALPNNGGNLTGGSIYVYGR